MLKTTSTMNWAVSWRDTGQCDGRCSEVLKVTQVKPSHEFVAWHALVEGYAPKSSNDPAIALQPTLATPERCKDAKGIEGEAHSMVIESGPERASNQATDE